MYRDLIPDIIVGDFDSVRDDVKSYYSSKGTVLVFAPSQDYHDLDKSMLCAIDHIFQLNPNETPQKRFRSLGGIATTDSDESLLPSLDQVTIELQKKIEQNNFSFNSAVVYVVGGLGGRFDQTMSCISSMRRWTILGEL